VLAGLGSPSVESRTEPVWQRRPLREPQGSEPEEFTGDYVESPEETAECWSKDGSAVQPMREVVWMLKSAEFEEFGEHLRVLKQA